MIVVQCWDDGVTTDIRLLEILRRHGAKATFNLNAGLHESQREPGWIYRDTEVQRLAKPELLDVYTGFTIANHSLTHPHLDTLPPENARRDVVEGRARLQQLFQQPVLGFAYPFGTYNETVWKIVQDAGHVYARATQSLDQNFPPKNPFEFRPSCHFLDPDFWTRYEQARAGGVFYFWGHSYEMIDEAMWSDFDAKIARISADPTARWDEVAALFTHHPQQPHA